MKLSEAILLGSMLGPHCKYVFRQHSDGSMCVMGAAFYSQGVENLDLGLAKGQLSRYLKAFGWSWIENTALVAAQSPIREFRNTHTVLYTIIALNDQYSWTRPRIAAWVASIEPKEPLRLEDKRPGCCEKQYALQEA